MSSKHRKGSSAKAVFKSLPESVTHALANSKSPLEVGLAALAIAQDRARVDYLSIAEIVSCLETSGIAVKPQALQKAFARAGNRITTTLVNGERKHKLMLPGRQSTRRLLGSGNIEIVFVKGGQPRTARKTLADILADSDGLIRIMDPWYGERTLDSLDLIPKECEVRFLTGQTNEKLDKLRRAIADFKKERHLVEFRACTDPKELHDRYVLTDTRLLIVGHGLKDIGSRESFIIGVDRSFAPDLLDAVRSTFDLRWGKATPIL